MILHRKAVPNVKYSDQTIFFLYDTVHVMKCIRNNWLNKTDKNQMKCIRNNWLNKTDKNQTFVYPQILSL